MINAVLELIKSTITEKPFVERYGGLVIRVNNESSNGRPCYFPVSCNVEAAQCFEQGRFLDLMPNSEYSSLFYWECIKDLTLQSAGSRKNNEQVHRGTIRLVGWLNLVKLGWAGECDRAEKVAYELLRDIEAGNRYTMASPFIGSSVDMCFSSLVCRDPAIFSKYSYDEKKLMSCLLGLYDFFAIDLDVKIHTKLNCIEDNVLGTPGELDCIDLTTL